MEEFEAAADLFIELLDVFQEKPDVVRACLWFLLGLCQLATEAVEESRESFMRSYALNSRWVDDFLVNHKPPELFIKIDTLLKPLRSQTPRAPVARPWSGDYEGHQRPSGRLTARPSSRRSPYLSAHGQRHQPVVCSLAGEKGYLGSRLPGKKLRM